MKLLRYASIVLIVAILVAPAALSAAPQQETVMRILQPCEPPPPMRTWNAFYRCRPTAMILEPLFWYSRGERKFYPWLAEKFIEEDVGKFIKVTVKLRKGVEWSDGKPFTAYDVLTTYWCYMLIKWWPLRYVDHIEATDNYTVIIYVKKPPHVMWKWFILAKPKIVSYTQYGQFAPGLKVPGKIPLEGVDMEALRKKLLDYRPDKLIGTGPYVYESYTDTEWIYKKREGYWVEKLGLYWGGAKFDKIHWYRRISDPASWPLIMARKFDYTWTGLSPECYKTMARMPGYWTPKVPWLHGHALYFNCRRYPLNITEVRWAIAYAIDRDEYCSVAIEWGPESVVKAEWPVCISPADVYYWLSKDWLNKWINKYEYNPQKAEEILKSLGFTKKDGKWYLPTGEQFKLTVHVPAGWAGWVPGAENVATQLTKFGIETTVIELDWGMWGKTIREKGDFWLAIDFWTYGTMHPYDSYWRFYYSYTVGVAGLGFDPIVEVPEGVSKIHGKVNATELAIKLAEYRPDDPNWPKEYVKALAYITNHYLPVLQMHEKVWCGTVNIERTTGWPIGQEKLLVEMGNNPGFVYGFLICSGMVRPPAPAAPTVPPEIPEIAKAVGEIKTAVGELKTSIEEVSSKVAAISGQLGTLSAAVAIEGIVIIILAIGLVLAIRRRPS